LQLARIIDATVYLCRADYTTKDSFVLINSLAMEKKLPNMSIVINGLDMTKKKYGYYYGYGRYAKYGKYAKYGYGRYNNNSYIANSYNSYNTYGGYDRNNNSYRDKNDSSIKQ
ncbi:MAG: capsid assembly protein, partial [Bacteroidetes bacterium]|nr:capsid assembly protein [Bacteroidota bacterium]